jgi:hypothetical protein
MVATALVARMVCTLTEEASSCMHAARMSADFPTPAGPETIVPCPSGPVTLSTSSAISGVRPTILCETTPGLDNRNLVSCVVPRFY